MLVVNTSSITLLEIYDLLSLLAEYRLSNSQKVVNVIVSVFQTLLTLNNNHDIQNFSLNYFLEEITSLYSSLTKEKDSKKSEKIFQQQMNLLIFDIWLFQSVNLPLVSQHEKIVSALTRCDPFHPSLKNNEKLILVYLGLSKSLFSDDPKR